MRTKPNMSRGCGFVMNDDNPMLNLKRIDIDFSVSFVLIYIMHVKVDVQIFVGIPAAGSSLRIVSVVTTCT